MDMELLYHSCRVSEAVARETIAEVKRLWSFATTEPMRLRVLSVADRLLDPVVLKE